MVGDAPGDKSAAEKNGVWFYPILVRHESESWAELAAEGLNCLRSGNFARYAGEKGQQFEQNLER